MQQVALELDRAKPAANSCNANLASATTYVSADGTTYHFIAGTRSASEIRANDITLASLETSMKELASPSTAARGGAAIAGWRASHEIKEDDLPIDDLRTLMPEILKCGNDVDCGSRLLRKAREKSPARRLMNSGRPAKEEGRRLQKALQR